MPFESKAQQRLFFAKNPKKAKEWARETPDIKGLPEKKHPAVNPKKKKLPGVKIAGDGMFAQHAVEEAPANGRFFSEMPGRSDASFHEKTAIYSYAPGQIPSGAGANVSPGAAYGAGEGPKPHTTKADTGGVEGGMASSGAVGGHGFRGEGMGGGMYGAGEGDSKETKEKKSDEARLIEMLAKAGPGKERKAGEDEEKTAGKTPNEWDAESGLPTGFHRPAYEQPEALEAGGDRFHSTEARGPEYGAGEGFTHSTTSGSFSMKATSSPQMGKHASASMPPRFLGTSYALTKQAAAGDYATERGREFTGSLRRGVGSAGERLDELAKSITRSPGASLLTAALMTRFGLRGGKRALRGAKGLVRRVRGKPPAPRKPKGIIEGIGAAARGLAAKLK